MRELRSQGRSLAEIAEQTGSTATIVRRIVGKVDPVQERERRRFQEEVALRIDTEPLTFNEKVARWKAEIGQNGATFWPILKRARGNPV
jgi:hypothetical protein